MGRLLWLLILVGASWSGGDAAAVTRDFVGFQGGPFAPTAATVELFCRGSDAGNPTLTVRFAVEGVPDWLTVTPNQGQFTCATPQMLTLRPSDAANALPVGTVTATWGILTFGAIEDRATVTTNLQVQPPNRAALRAVSPLNQLARLQSREALAVELRDNNNRPVSGVALDWQLITVTPALQGTDTGARLEILDPTTNDAGRSSAVLFTGERSATYEIRVRTGNSQVTFVREVGLAAGIADGDRPEAVVGGAIDSLCPQMVAAAERGELDASQEKLLEQCSSLIEAADDPNIDEALRELAPTGNSAFRDMGERTANAQFTNIGNRLTVLRSGAPAGALSGLNLRWGEGGLAGSQWKTLARSVGSGAGESPPETTLDPNALLGGRLGVFLSGNARFGQRDDTAQSAGFDFSTYGLTGGVDYRFTSDLILGMALGLATADLENTDNVGQLDTRGVSVSVYGNYFVTPSWYLESVVSYALNGYDQTRRTQYQLGDEPPVDERFNSDPDGHQFGVSLATGYDWRFESGWTFGLRGKANYLKTTVDRYTEDNSASGLNLQVEELDAESLILSLEGQVARPLSYGWGVLIPQLTLALETERLDDPLRIQARFANDPFSTPMRFQSDSADTSYLRVGLGLTAVQTGGVMWFINYDGSFGKDHYDYDFTLNAGVRLEFD